MTAFLSIFINWIVGFFRSPVGQFIGRILLALVALAVLYWWAYGNGRRQCEASHAAAERAMLVRQVEDTTRVLGAAADRATKAADKAASNSRKVTDATAKAAGSADAHAACVPADIADGLRSID